MLQLRKLEKFTVLQSRSGFLAHSVFLQCTKHFNKLLFFNHKRFSLQKLITQHRSIWRISMKWHLTKRNTLRYLCVRNAHKYAIFTQKNLYCEGGNLQCRWRIDVELSARPRRLRHLGPAAPSLQKILWEPVVEFERFMWLVSQED